MPAFHGLLLTKDDADIIEACILHAMSWCDYLYVLDTGSIDATLKIVKLLAYKDSRIHLLESSEGPILMQSGLRGYLLNHFSWNIADGDWVFQVDSDEFYHISPKSFVKERLKPYETGLLNLTFEFRLTKQEVLLWYQSGSPVAMHSIAESRRYYNVLSHSEPRGLQFRSSMKWPPNIAYPYNAAHFSSARIPVRHYPQRSPLQLQKRWALRYILSSLADQNWSHWQQKSWELLLADESDQDLFYWEQGEDLPDCYFHKHAYSAGKALFKYLLHQSPLVRLLDSFRPSQSDSYKPHPLPPDINQKIKDAYQRIDSMATSSISPFDLLSHLDL
jgi:hypothetical protein